MLKEKGAEQSTKLKLRLCSNHIPRCAAFFTYKPEASRQWDTDRETGNYFLLELEDLIKNDSK